MFRRRTNKPSFLLHASNRGSDITKPDNTSLIVNQSGKKSETRTEEVRKSLCLSSEDEDDMNCDNRQSTSVMRSMTQKMQSTPVRSPILTQQHGNTSQIVNSPVLSKKSPARKILAKENIVTSSSQSKKSYYEEIVESCGAVRLPGMGSYLLSEDQAVFTININKKIAGENSEEKFLKSLEDHIKDVDSLKKMLAHTQTSDDCEVARGPVQEPIMRLLLQADCIQTGLCELLLNKIADLILDVQDPENADFGLVGSVLRQFRFLSRVKECKIAGKFFEIIDVAPVNIQREIIFLLPEILTEDEIEAEKVDAKLVDLLKFNSILTHVIIDALTNLPLNAELRSQVREKIINRLEKCPAEYLPLLVQFVITRCDQSDLPEVVNSLRQNLPFTIKHHEIRLAENTERSGKKNEMKIIDENSYFKLTFENLKFSVMSSKQMTDAWIKIITNVKTPNELRCVDLIMLIIIYSNVFGRKNQMATLMRNKIKTGVLEETHVQHFFKILLVVAVEFSSAILELASIFLKSYEPAIADFGAALYEEAFTNYSFYLRQNVISEILLHVGAGTCSNINMALAVLSHLTEKNLETLSEHTVSIMGLLMKLPDLEAMQVRTLVDIIASLIFSNFTDDALGAQDELQMFIQKQISAYNVELHRKGVVAAVMYAKHAVANAEGDNFEGKLKEANSLLELAMGPRISCESKRAFFYDELATMLRENKPNAKFAKMWNEQVYQQALEFLFARNIDLECDNFPMSLQYALEVPDDKKLVFPILDFIIKLNTDKKLDIPVPVIPSILRLLFVSEEDFSRIEPFICASVIMPAPSVFDKFGSFDLTEQKMILDCLYLCANFFIECINAFSCQKTNEKLIIRIKQLIEVRKLIVKYQPFLPDYTPPLCQFYAPIQKLAVKKRAEPKKTTKKGKKRKSDGTTAEPGPSSQAPSQPPISQVRLDSSDLPGTSANASISVEVVGHAGVAHEESDLHAYRGYFRELQGTTLKILRVDMTLNPTVVFKKTKLSDILVDEVSWCYRPTEKPELGPPDLLFLLEDFIYKAEQVFKERRVGFNMKNRPIFSTIEHLTAEVFIEGSIKILPKLCTKLNLLSSYCKDLLEANDGVYDAIGMYPKDAADIKLAFVAGLRAIAVILSWRGFQNPNNRPLLKDALRILSSTTASQSIATVANLASQAGDYLANFSSTVPLLSGAISIVKSIENCFQYGHHRNNILYSLCYELLCRPWFTVNGIPEKGAVYNQNVDFLLKTYFATVDDKLEIVKKLCKLAVDEIEQLTGRDSAMDTLRTINKSNFPLLYRALCEGLVSGASTELAKVQDDHELCLELWGTIVHAALTLVEIVKIQPSRMNLAALLKRSQAIIQLFLSKGMRVMETALRIKANEVLKLLKKLQGVTRFLHAICCHSKITSDSVVAAHVPAIRSLCERITLEVKGMLILNKIPLDCITIAVLKNRDLDGNDILSQTTNNDSDDESDLPAEELISDMPDTEQENNDDDEDESRASTPEGSNSEIF